MIRVLLAEDHSLVRAGLADLLANVRDFEVVGAAADGAEAVTLAAERGPQVVLMDLVMPGLDGIEATRIILAEPTHTRVLILTGSNARIDIDRSRAAGAAGYVTKDRIAAELIDAIVEIGRRAADG